MTARIDNVDGLKLTVTCGQCYNAAISFTVREETFADGKYKVFELDEESYGSYLSLNDAFCVDCAKELHQGHAEHARIMAR